MRNLRNANSPPDSDLVQIYLRSSWDVVIKVYENLADINTVADGLDSGDLTGFLSDTDINTLAKLNALVLDATLGDAGDFATAAQGVLADNAIAGPIANEAQALGGTENTLAMSSLRVAQAIADGAGGRLNNYTAITDPGVTDDAAAGYSSGSVWFNTTSTPDETFRCTDATNGAASWIKTSLTSDELSTVATSGDSDHLIEGSVQLLMTVTERSRLAAMDDNAADDQTGAEIKTAYELEDDTNAFDDNAVTKLAGIQTAAQADQTDSEIETAYNNQVALVGQAEAEAGTSTTRRGWTAERVKQAIVALGGSSGGVTWSTSAVDKAVLTATGTVYQDMTEQVDATLPTSPAVGDFVWLANNDNSGWTVRIMAGASNEINENVTVYIPNITLKVGETAILTCISDGTPKRWTINRFSKAVGFDDVNDETGTTYQFLGEDLTKAVVANNASASVYDIGDGLGVVGNVLNLYNKGAGTVTIEMAGTDTLDTSDNDCLQYHAVTMLKIAATVWAVIGGS